MPSLVLFSPYIVDLHYLGRIFISTRSQFQTLFLYLLILEEEYPIGIYMLHTFSHFSVVLCEYS